MITSKDDVLFARRFVLRRANDVTGISGTGDVADGVVWPDGTASVRWRGEHPSVAFWDRGRVSIEFINGHVNASTLEFHDPEQPTGFDARQLRQALDMAVINPRPQGLIDTILIALGPWLAPSLPEYVGVLSPDADETLIRYPVNADEAMIELQRLQVVARRYRDQAPRTTVAEAELNRQLSAVRDVVTDMEGITGVRSWAKWLRAALGDVQPATGSNPVQSTEVLSEHGPEVVSLPPLPRRTPGAAPSDQEQ